MCASLEWLGVVFACKQAVFSPIKQRFRSNASPWLCKPLNTNPSEAIRSDYPRSQVHKNGKNMRLVRQPLSRQTTNISLPPCKCNKIWLFFPFYVKTCLLIRPTVFTTTRRRTETPRVRDSVWLEEERHTQDGALCSETQFGLRAGVYI